MDKPTFLAVLAAQVTLFEAPTFRAAYADAKARGDVQRLLALVQTTQREALEANGLDDVTAGVPFKAAGRAFGLDPDVAALLARMKAALDK